MNREYISKKGVEFSNCDDNLEPERGRELDRKKLFPCPSDGGIASARHPICTICEMLKLTRIVEETAEKSPDNSYPTLVFSPQPVSSTCSAKCTGNQWMDDEKRSFSSEDNRPEIGEIEAISSLNLSPAIVCMNPWTES